MMQRNLKLRAALLTVLMMFVFATSAFAAEEGGPLAALGINPGFLIVQIINFFLVAGLLTALLWRPMGNMLDSRAAKIEQGLKDAAEAANARRNAEADAEKILASARIEAQKLVEEGRRRGEELERAVKATATEEANKIRETSRVAAEQERDALLSGMRSQVASVSVALANRILGENLDDKRQQSLIADFFSRVPADAKSLRGAVEVVSAMPLSDDEKNNVSREIGSSDVSFRVDPAILGGLVLRSSDYVVDGSVRSNLNNLASRLN